MATLPEREALHFTDGIAVQHTCNSQRKTNRVVIQRRTVPHRSAPVGSKETERGAEVPGWKKEMMMPLVLVVWALLSAIGPVQVSLLVFLLDGCGPPLLDAFLLSSHS